MNQADNILEMQFVNKSGDSMTGPLVLSGDPTLPGHAATRSFVEFLVGMLRSESLMKDASVQLTAEWNAGNFRITARRLTSENMDMNHIWPFSGADITIHGNLIFTGAIAYHVDTFAANDATPDVSDADMWQTANALATTITQFDGMVPGRKYLIRIADANTTLAHGANLILPGGGMPSTLSYDVNDILQIASFDGTVAIVAGVSINSP